MSDFETLKKNISACSICEDRFRATHTAHAPRPVFWLNSNAHILIAGQAPGARVHNSGKPFTDPSGDRLRDWMGLDEDQFYDQDKVAILPMAFCFPGYNAAGSDLAPPKVCARTWRKEAVAHLKNVKLTLVVGGYAQKWHLDNAATVQANVENWQSYAPDVFPLPHPSWRNSGWLKRNPWFNETLVPQLRATVSKVLKT